MHSNRCHCDLFRGASLLVVLMLASAALMFAQSQMPVKKVGTVKSITPEALTIAADGGGEFTAQFGSSTRIRSIEPGEKDLSKAVSLQAGDIQVGDRVIVKALVQPESNVATAADILAMKKSDIAARDQQVMREWQHGVGGLVKAVDPATRTVTISSLSSATKDINVVLLPNATLRRYAPGSIRFDDAKPSTLEEIHPGDQLRARGTRSADGTEFTAQEIVTGAFRNLSGVLSAVDPASGTLTFQDLATKKTVSVVLNKDSQLKKVPEMLAQRLATRLKGGAQQGQATATSQPPVRPASGEGATRNAGGGDLQQMLARLPSAGISDLQKGDAVLIVATQESSTTKPTVITLLSGVEPILSASPNGGGASLLTPWTLSSAPE